MPLYEVTLSGTCTYTTGFEIEAIDEEEALLLVLGGEGSLVHEETDSHTTDNVEVYADNERLIDRRMS